MWYKCKFCNKISDDIGDIYECETNHLGLTLKEYCQYCKLQETAYKRISMIRKLNSPEIINEEKWAVMKLKEFEKLHGISEKIK